MKHSIVGLLLILSFSVYAQTNPPVQRGPFSVNFDAQAAYGKDNRLFVTSTSGVYYTDDRETWKLSFYYLGYGAGLTTDESGNVYYYQNGQVYKTMDNGASWQYVSLFLLTDDVTGEVKSLSTQNTRARIDGDTVFVSGRNGLGYVVGNDFSGVFFHALADKTLSDLEVDGDRIVAVDEAGMMHYSLDRGVNWSSVSLPAGGSPLAKIALSGNKLWVFSNATYYTEDWGDNWEQRDDGRNGNFTKFQWVDDKLYASGANVYLYSEDNEQWESIEDIGAVVVTIAMDDDHFFAAAVEDGMSDGIFKESTNGGDTWDDVPLTGYTSSDVRSLVIDSDSTIYASVGNAVFRKVKGGSSFQRFLPGATAQILLDGDFLYVIDDGRNLTKYDKTSGLSASSVEVDPSYSMVELVKDGTDIFVNVAYQRIARVTAAGNVDEFNTGLENKSMTRLFADNGNLYVRAPDGIYKTSSTTANWQKMDIDVNMDYMDSFHVRDNTIIISCSTDQDGFNGSIISHDGGDTWKPMEVGTFIRDIKYSDGVYYGGGYLSAFVSYDNGDTWLTKSLETPIVNSNVVLPTKDSIYIGTLGTGTYSFKKLRFQKITFDEISDKTMGDDPFEIQATSSEDLDVEFSIDPELISIEGKEVTLLKPGRVSILASQTGTTKVEGALAISRTFCINPAKAVITMSDSTENSVKLNIDYDGPSQWYKDGEIIENATQPSYEVTEDGKYTVVLSADDCKSETSDEFTFPIPPPPPVLGVNESVAAGIRIYPNPVTEEINIVTPVDSQIELTNMLGVTIDSRTSMATRNESINMRSAAKGLYLIRINMNGNVIVRRILKQ